MNPQMKTEQVVVTCLRCKKSSRLQIINDKDIMYIDHTPIISCRLRGDLNWGFECQCGNDSRLAREEKDQAKVLVQGGEHALKKLIKSLQIKDERKFRMRAA